MQGLQSASPVATANNTASFNVDDLEFTSPFATLKSMGTIDRHNPRALEDIESPCERLFVQDTDPIAQGLLSPTEGAQAVET